MSGLDSIALAVAHLEEMSSRNAEEPKAQKAEEPRVSTNTSHEQRDEPLPTTEYELDHPALIPPKSVAVNPRVVSSDSIFTSYPAATAEEDENDASTSKLVPILSKQPEPTVQQITNKNLAYILADPHTWLRNTEQLKIPEGPLGATDTVEPNDVLCGRGGESNHHSGNQQYRRLVKAFQPLYIASKRRFKPKIAQCIVYTVRSFGGRFLRRTDPRSSQFEDVGNTKAREKTSQALREGAPELRGTMDGDGPEQPSSASNDASQGSSGQSAVAPEAPNNNQHQASMHPSSAGGMPPFMNQQFLQAQLGAYSGAFGPLLPAFAAFNPYRQALWMANNNPAAQQQPQQQKTKTNPSIKKGNEAINSDTHGQKRSIHVVSSSEENSSTSSMSTATSIPCGPRLKRLKQRLIQEHSDEEEAISSN